MATPDLIILAPTASGVRAVVSDRESFRPMTAQQLLDMSLRFAEAAAERLRQDAGQWCPRATDALR